MEPGHQLLHKLFNLWQSNPDGQRRKSLPITRDRAEIYFQTVNPDDKDRLHDSLRCAEKAGCIALEWGKHHDNHLLKKIWLVDGESLANHLGEPLARDIANQSKQAILKEIPNDPWLQEVLSRIVSQWDKNKPAYRIPPGGVEDAVALLTALSAVRDGMQEGLDLRTFSAKTLGDSKAMERMRDRFTRVWNEKFETGLDGPELFESLGLMKFAPLIHLKGPISVKVGHCWLPIHEIPGYLGIPPDTITDIRLVDRPEYLLTIENLASFNRHCREIDDRGIIVYTAGFFGPATAPVLTKLESIVASTVPFYHWGDIDAGGLNIARHVQSLIQRELELHQMTLDLLHTQGKGADSIGGTLVPRKISCNRQIEALVETLLAGPPYITLEQEAIDPLPPVQTVPTR